MTFTPKLLEQYRECERALKEAERLLIKDDHLASLHRLEKILSADTDAVTMLRKHREYGPKLDSVLGKIHEAKMRVVDKWRSEQDLSYRINEAVETPRIIAPTSYLDLEWETYAAYCREGYSGELTEEKERFTFDKSLKRLRNAGYERHPLATEVFSLMMEGINRRLSGDFQNIFSDMLSDSGEWLSLAFERTKLGVLNVYTNPEGLVWHKKAYVMKDFKYSDVQSFDISGINSEKGGLLRLFSNDFIKHIYGCELNVLPEQIKDTLIYLPPVGMIAPIARAYSPGLGICCYNNGKFEYNASRGVRVQLSGRRGLVPTP